MGLFHGGFTALYSFQFASYLLNQEPKVRNELRLVSEEKKRGLNCAVSGINLGGEIASAGDWFASESWISVTKVQLICLRVIANVASFISYSKSMLDVLGGMCEIERLAGEYKENFRFSAIAADAIEVRKYVLWADLFFNYLLWVYSGAELATAITGVVVIAAPMLNLILVAGIASLLAGRLLDLGAKDAALPLENLKAASPRYTYIGR